MFKNWKEWHKFMKSPGAISTVDSVSFLLEGGCPECGCKSWQITGDGWAFCNNCGYGQKQTFDDYGTMDIYDVCPDHPCGCSFFQSFDCRKKWKGDKIRRDE